MSGHQIGFWKHSVHNEKVYECNRSRLRRDSRRRERREALAFYAWAIPVMGGFGLILGTLTYHIIKTVMTWPR